MKKYLLFLGIISISYLPAQNLQAFFKDANTFFQIYIKDGKVDYKGIKKDISSLENLISFAENIQVNTKDENNYKAFWINSYNLLTIKGIIKHYPINSPLDVKGFFDKKEYTVGGESITLNDIENKKLRAKFKDPRIHFVLVCGAKGCPPLINKAYLPNELETLLDQQTKEAVNSNFIKINTKKKTVYASKIMEWYKEDFVLNGTEIDFLNQYLSTPISKKFKIKYFEYDWNLNKQ